MSKELISDALGETQDSYIAEAISYRRPRRRVWIELAALAACLCLIVAAALPLARQSTPVPEPAPDCEPMPEPAPAPEPAPVPCLFSSVDALTEAVRQARRDGQSDWPMLHLEELTVLYAPWPEDYPDDMPLQIEVTPSAVSYTFAARTGEAGRGYSVLWTRDTALTLEEYAARAGLTVTDDGVVYLADAGMLVFSADGHLAFVQGNTNDEPYESLLPRCRLQAIPIEDDSPAEVPPQFEQKKTPPRS